MGSDPIAIPLLDWLSGAGAYFGEVIAVFTQPDRRAGRGQKITPNAIKLWAQAHDLPVYQPDRLTSEIREELASLHADVSLVMAYGQILKQDFIDTPRLGTLNLHASLLPNYRGASPIQTAIASGEVETGISLMRIVRELDAGPVADIEKVIISKTDTALDIESNLSGACIPLLARNLPQLSLGQLVFIDQNASKASYCRRLTKNDGVLDFSESASKLAARINGLFPWPTCTAPMQDQIVKFGLADIVQGAAAPGLLVGTDEVGLLIGTGCNLLRIRRLQRPGGRMLSATDFIRGLPLEIGTQLPSVPMPNLVSDIPFRR
jgi:methionyl-tRNA formyltransferase